MSSPNTSLAIPVLTSDSSGRTLLRTRRPPWQDWLELIAILLPALIVIALGIKYSGFMRAAIDANPALNYTILAVLLVGIAVMGWTAWHCVIQRRAFVAWFDTAQEPTRIRRWHEQFGFSLVGESLKRMFGHGSAKDSEGLLRAVETESTSVLHGFEHRHEIGAYLVGGMVALGLLGTFIGLLETLGSISTLVTGVLTGLNNGGAIETAITNMVGQLRGPLNSMATAFSASMFGVTGSVVLGLMLVLLRRRANAFTEALKDDAYDHANVLIVRHGLVDENKLTTGFLRQHLGAVAESLTRQSLHFEQVAGESARIEARIAAAVESMDRVAIVYGDLANRLLAIDGMVAQLRELVVVQGQQLDCGRQTQSLAEQLLSVSLSTHSDLNSIGTLIDQCRTSQVEGVGALVETLSTNADELKATMAASTSALIESQQSSTAEMNEAMAPLVDIQGGLQVIESLLSQANEEGTKRGERGMQVSAKLVATMQVLRDTVAGLAQSQEEDVRQLMSKIERHVVELKGLGVGTEAMMKTLVQKSTESSSVLGRHTGLFEAMRISLESRRSGWAKGPVLAPAGTTSEGETEG